MNLVHQMILRSRKNKKKYKQSTQVANLTHFQAHTNNLKWVNQVLNPFEMSLNSVLKQLKTG